MHIYICVCVCVCVCVRVCVFVGGICKQIVCRWQFLNELEHSFHTVKWFQVLLSNTNNFIAPNQISLLGLSRVVESSWWDTFGRP